MQALQVDARDEAIWLPLTRAAGRLGISVDTVRRRAKDGTYAARKVPTRYGPAWQVRLDPARLQESFAGEHAMPAGERADVAALVQVVGSLQDRLVELARQVGYLEGRLHELQSGVRSESA